MMTGVVEVANQLVSIEVLMGIEDVANKHPPWLGELFPSYFQELAEFLDRRLGNHHSCHWFALHFRPDSDSRTAPRSSFTVYAAGPLSIMILHSIRGHGSASSRPDTERNQRSSGVSGITAPLAGALGLLPM